MRSLEVVLKLQDVENYETVMAQVLLRWLGFQLCVDHPYRYLLNFANALRCGALSADLHLFCKSDTNTTSCFPSQTHSCTLHHSSRYLPMQGLCDSTRERELSCMSRMANTAATMGCRRAGGASVAEPGERQPAAHGPQRPSPPHERCSRWVPV